MKQCIFFLFLATLISCKKESNNSTTGQGCSVAPFRIGTEYTYFFNGSGVTVTQKYDKDTAINGKQYFRTKRFNYTTGAFVNYNYLHVDNSGSVYTIYNNVNDILAVDVVIVKTGQPIGKTWSYTFPSISAPASKSYVYLFEILSNTETFTVNSKQYTNGIRIKQTMQTFSNGTFVSAFYSASTYFCGLGETGSDNTTGTPLVTLTNYVY